jgi:hypothetical protein
MKIFVCPHSLIHSLKHGFILISFTISSTKKYLSLCLSICWHSFIHSFIHWFIKAFSHSIIFSFTITSAKKAPIGIHNSLRKIFILVTIHFSHSLKHSFIHFFVHYKLLQKSALWPSICLTFSFVFPLVFVSNLTFSTL